MIGSVIKGGSRGAYQLSRSALEKLRKLFERPKKAGTGDLKTTWSSGKESAGKYRGQRPAVRGGLIGRHPYVSSAAGIGAGGGLLGLMSSDDDIADSSVTQLNSGMSPSARAADMAEWEFDQDILSRAEFLKSKQSFINKNMQKMLEDYFVINMANSEGAKDYLRMMTPFLKLQVEQFGDERQAKILDSVFDPDNMPKNAMIAWDRTMKAGSDAALAKEITGAMVDMRPKSTSKTDDAMQLADQVSAYFYMGQEQMARDLLRQGILTGIFKKQKGEGGIDLSMEQQIDRYIEQLKLRDPLIAGIE